MSSLGTKSKVNQYSLSVDLEISLLVHNWGER